MKNVLILSGSPRKGGNSDLLCDEFMRGAKEAGNNVAKINVANKKWCLATPAIFAVNTAASAPTKTIWWKFCRQ